MRVAIFSESLPPLTDGVARTYTWLAKAMEETGVDFRFVSPCVPSEDEPWKGRVLAQPWATFPLYRYYRVALPWPPSLFKHLDAFKPDLIQAAAPTPLGWLALYYAKRRGIPFISSYHTHFTDYFPYYHLGFLQGPGWALLRRFHNAGLATLVPGEDCRRRLQQQGIQGLTLWERGLDASAFSPRYRSEAERARWAAPDEALLLYVGRLVADKELDLLADALERLRAKGRRLRCVFAGDGSMKAGLQRRLGQDHFPGFVRGAALARLYASCDLFTFPSPNETFGNVVLEAQASGLPVLAVDAGGPSGLIRHGQDGCLVPPRDSAAFADAVAALLDDPSRRAALAQGGLASAGRLHWREVHGRLIRFYEATVHGDKKAAAMAAAAGSVGEPGAY